MHTLINRIAAARDAAAEREGDIRIKELLKAATILQNPDAGMPLYITVNCHSRSWIHNFQPDELESLEMLSHELLIQTAASWVQAALASGLLTLSDPPSLNPLHGRPVGGVVTTIFDSRGSVVGSRW